MPNNSSFHFTPAAAAGVLLVFASLLAGCATSTHQGGVTPVASGAVHIFLAPFHNATDDDHAGRALTEITASILAERGISLANDESANTRARTETAPGPDGLYTETVKSLKATHVLLGTVHEYRYKTDLNGDPVIGISMRLVDAATGQAIWQGSSSRVGVFLSSLSVAAQKAVRDLVRQMPVTQPPARKWKVF